MELKKLFINILKLSVIVLVLDSIFLLSIKDFFNSQIKKVQSNDIRINMLGVVITYIFIIFVIYYFIIKDKRSIKDAFLLGICVYGVYEYTNYSLFNNWNFTTTLIDTLWGGILFSLTTYIYNYFEK